MARQRVGIQKRTSARGPAELGAAPHGESKIIEMPIRTDQRRETDGQNVAQTTNTKSGSLAPSVDSTEVSRMGGRNKKASSRPAIADTSEKPRHKTLGTSAKKNTRNTA